MPAVSFQKMPVCWDVKRWYVPLLSSDPLRGNLLPTSRLIAKGPNGWQKTQPTLLSEAGSLSESVRISLPSCSVTLLDW